MMKTSVWALNEQEVPGERGGLHWRVSYPGYPVGRGQKDPTARDEALRRLGLNESRRRAMGVDLSVFTANVRPIHDGNHPWRGLAPFPHFEPGQFAQTCGSSASEQGGPDPRTAALRAEDFNQPTSWVFFTKGPAALQLRSGAPGQLALTQGGRQTQLALEDSGIGLSALGLAPGLNVLSRGQTYYHRPGNWAEQPNFFNPYWRPRLASVYQGRRTLPWVEELIGKLPPELRGKPQKALTH
jgi:hypothetical protein